MMAIVHSLRRKVRLSRPRTLESPLYQWEEERGPTHGCHPRVPFLYPQGFGVCQTPFTVTQFLRVLTTDLGDHVHSNWLASSWAPGSLRGFWGPSSSGPPCHDGLECLRVKQAQDSQWLEDPACKHPGGAPEPAETVTVIENASAHAIGMISGHISRRKSA